VLFHIEGTQWGPRRFYQKWVQERGTIKGVTRMGVREEESYKRGPNWGPSRRYPHGDPQKGFPQCGFPNMSPQVGVPEGGSANEGPVMEAPQGWFKKGRSLMGGQKGVTPMAVPHGVPPWDFPY
jgi:hypothetical protein